MLPHICFFQENNNGSTSYDAFLGIKQCSLFFAWSRNWIQAMSKFKSLSVVLVTLTTFYSRYLIQVRLCKCTFEIFMIKWKSQSTLYQWSWEETSGWVSIVKGGHPSQTTVNIYFSIIERMVSLLALHCSKCGSSWWQFTISSLHERRPS